VRGSGGVIGSDERKIMIGKIVTGKEGSDEVLVVPVVGDRIVCRLLDGQGHPSHYVFSDAPSEEMRQLFDEKLSANQCTPCFVGDKVQVQHNVEFGYWIEMIYVLPDDPRLETGGVTLDPELVGKK